MSLGRPQPILQSYSSVAHAPRMLGAVTCHKNWCLWKWRGGEHQRESPRGPITGAAVGLGHWGALPFHVPPPCSDHLGREGRAQQAAVRAPHRGRPRPGLDRNSDPAAGVVPPTGSSDSFGSGSVRLPPLLCIPVPGVDWKDDFTFASCSQDMSICVGRLGDTQCLRVWGPAPPFLPFLPNLETQTSEPPRFLPMAHGPGCFRVPYTPPILARRVGE